MQGKTAAALAVGAVVLIMVLAISFGFEHGSLIGRNKDESSSAVSSSADTSDSLNVEADSGQDSEPDSETADSSEESQSADESGLPAENIPVTEEYQDSGDDLAAENQSADDGTPLDNFDGKSNSSKTDGAARTDSSKADSKTDSKADSKSDSKTDSKSDSHDKTAETTSAVTSSVGDGVIELPIIPVN